MSYPLAPKAKAAGAGAGAAGAVLFLLQQFVFRGAVPPAAESLVYLVVPGVLALAAAYRAPHQDRAPSAPLTARDRETP